MPYVTANGVQIHYREVGEGPAVLLVHGFTGNLRNWALQIPVLTKDFRAVSLDLRGHGHSDKPTAAEDYTLETMAEDVYAFMRERDLRSCFLVGHSMGGMIAQHLILAHPEPFRALVLVDTAAEIPDSLTMRERREERARLIDIARAQGMEAVFEEQLRLSPQREQLLANPQFLEIWRQQFLLTSREAYIHCANGIAKRRAVLDALGAVEVPTLVICGENDEPFLEPSRRLHERIPGSQLVIIHGAGHTPQIEKAAEFNGALMGFLGRVRQSVAAGG